MFNRRNKTSANEELIMQLDNVHHDICKAQALIWEARDLMPLSNTQYHEYLDAAQKYLDIRRDQVMDAYAIATRPVAKKKWYQR